MSLWRCCAPAPGLRSPGETKSFPAIKSPMAFFRSRTVNLLNLHYAIHAIALSGGASFFAVYLLKAGVSMPQVLVSLALILAGRFVVRPHHRSDRGQDRHEGAGHRRHRSHGAAISAARRGARGRSRSRRSLLILGARRHALLVELSRLLRCAGQSRAPRGSEVGAREAVAALVGIASPLITGWALVAFGSLVAFGATSVLLLLAALPLLFTPDVAVAAHAPGAFRAAIPWHEALPRRWLDCCRLLFSLADRSFLVARRELRRVRGRARSRRARRRGRRALPRPADRCGARGEGGRLCDRHAGYHHAVAGACAGACVHRGHRQCARRARGLPVPYRP